MTILGELTPVDSEIATAFDALVARRGRAYSQDLLFDLSGVHFVWPSGLVTLRTLLSTPEIWSCDRVTLRLPTAEGCRQYLGVAGFLHGLPAEVTIDSPETNANAGTWSAQTLLPLTSINTLQELEQLAHCITTRLDEMLGQGQAAAPDEPWRRQKSAIVSAIREMCHNVLEHAGAGGWIAAQRYRAKRTGAPFLEIAVADAGCGVRTSIARTHRSLGRAAEAAVLRSVVEQGLSRFGTDPTRGNGYGVLKRATRECDGSFFLRSGGGILEHPRRGPLRTAERSVRWPGTYLMLRLACR